jgi:hypothetical protein
VAFGIPRKGTREEPRSLRTEAEEWDYWYDGKPATKDLPDDCHRIVMLRPGWGLSLPAATPSNDYAQIGRIAGSKS